MLVNGKEVCQSHAAELLPSQSVVGFAPEEGAVKVLGVGEVEDPVQDLPGLPVLGVLVHPAGEGLGLAGFLGTGLRERRRRRIIIQLIFGRVPDSRVSLAVAFSQLYQCLCLFMSVYLCLSVCLFVCLCLSVCLCVPSSHFISWFPLSTT